MTENLRVLRVAQKCYPEAKGGGPYHVHAMSRDQAAMGHDVTVLTVRQDSDRPPVEECNGYTVVRREETAELLGNQLSAGLARDLFDDGRLDLDEFDVVHAHSHLYAASNLAALRCRLGEVPLAITNHGLYSQTAPEWLFDAYLRTAGRWTFDAADVVFCYTDVERARLRELGVDARIEVVPNGIDTERFEPDGRESDPIDADGPVVLFVGRLVEGKRPQDAVAAAERLREAVPDAELYLCGDGPLRDDLEAAAAERLGDAATFLGHVPYDEMPRVFRSVDALVLPSRAEGVPRTVLEALASGVPAVCSALPQLETLQCDGLETVPVGDVGAFADELRRLLRSDPDVGVASDYQWSATVEQTTRALQALAGREPAAPRRSDRVLQRPDTDD